MLARIGTFLGLTDAGHVPPRQSGSRPDQDFGAFVAAARMGQGEDKDAAATGAGASDVAQAEEAEAPTVDDAGAVQRPEAEPEEAEAIAVGFAEADPGRDRAGTRLMAAGAGILEDNATKTALAVAQSADTPGSRSDKAGAINDKAGARAAPASSDAATLARDRNDVRREHAASATARVDTRAAEPVNAAAAPSEAVAGTKTGASTASVVAEMQSKQPVAVSLQTDATPSGTTPAEFASHRASLQAEKLAQFMTAVGEARPDGKLADTAVQQAFAGATGIVERSSQSKKVESLIRIADTSADPDAKASDVGAAASRITAGAAPDFVKPAASFVSALAPQAVVAAGVTHPSILDVAEDGEALEYANHGGSTEVRAGSVQPSTFAQPARADTAAVVRQISESMPRAGNGSIEIRLSPDELGHVRLQMIPGESGMIVHIQAERAETLDLLRRHVDQLARDLAESGHDASGFTFDEGRDGDGRRDDARGGGASGALVTGGPGTEAGGDVELKAIVETRADGGLDMKI